MKWKLFFPIWLIVFLLAPSILTHILLMIGATSPGSPPIPKPLFIPFGAIHYGSDLLEQLARGDVGDALVIFIILILPILIYTFVLSVIIYYVYRKVKSKSRQMT